MDPFRRQVNPNGDLVERLLPSHSRKKCDITTCHERAARLIEHEGTVFGEYCVGHSRSMFIDILQRLRELPEREREDPVAPTVTGDGDA